MNIHSFQIEGPILIEPRVFEDERGSFMESHNHQKFKEAVGAEVDFVQDNESHSFKDVLRGLHYQSPPKAQAKLVRVVQGAVLDVIVDVREESATFGQHLKFVLSATNQNQLYIPEGFAHGFLALEENNVFLYKCSAYYSPEHENTLLWNDSDLEIDWGIDAPILSDKDQQGISFRDMKPVF